MTLTNKIRDYPAFPFHGVKFSKTTLTTLLPERKDRFGGPGRNRTDVQGFAILCITTLLPGQLVFFSSVTLSHRVRTKVFIEFIYISPFIK